MVEGVSYDKVYHMDEDDQDLWEKVSKSIKPMPEDETRKSIKKELFLSQNPKKSRKKDKIEEKTPQIPIKTPKNAPKEIKEDHSRQDHSNIDRKTWQKFKKGQISIDGRLDLHGLTLKQAQIKVENFILDSVQQHKRCLLIITGKGIKRFDTGDNTFDQPQRGVIKENFPYWLDTAPLKHKVLKYTPAAIKDGGSGAYYVYLKKDN